MFTRLKDDVRSIFKRDPAARSTVEILFNYPGLHAVFFHRCSHWLWTKGWFFLGRAVATFSRWLTGIEIHPGAQIGERFFIDHGMGVVIGETAVIGDDCTLYHGVTLGGVKPYDHDGERKRHPTLENDVVVGAGAQLLGAITIGTGARIGANAVITQSVKAHATMVGAPARQVGTPVEMATSEEAFPAYGFTSACEQEPASPSITDLLNRIQLLERQLQRLQQQQAERARADQVIHRSP